MNKPNPTVIALCALTAFTAILPHSYAGQFGSFTVAIDERGAQPAAIKPVADPIVGPVVTQDGGEKAKATRKPFDSSDRIAPTLIESPVPVAPYTSPLLIKPTN